MKAFLLADLRLRDFGHKYYIKLHLLTDRENGLRRVCDDGLERKENGGCIKGKYHVPTLNESKTVLYRFTLPFTHLI